jgi:hypothetical protein
MKITIMNEKDKELEISHKYGEKGANRIIKQF